MAKEKLLKKQNFDLASFKSKMNLNDGIKDKPLEFIKLGSAFHKATGLPGFPKGNISLIRGHSNTGKSTAIVLGIVNAQRQGILPIIIDTENSFPWERARDMGMDFEEVVDPDTGEIVNWSGDFIYINNDHLINNYGVKAIKNVDEATIEDVRDFCMDMLDKQKLGDLPYELAFFWDSIGTLDCRKCIESKGSNPMWNAAAYSQGFKQLSARIAGSRKINKKYTNTFIAVNKIWMQANAMGQPTVMHSGGDFFKYNARLIIHIGGANVAGVKQHTATSSGRTYVVGNEVKISIFKCHLTFDGAVLSDNKIVGTAHGFISPDEINDYKKDKRDYILNKLQAGEDAVIQMEEIEDNTIDNGLMGDAS